MEPTDTSRRQRSPGGLFWKVFAACWFTSMLTGLGINVVARLWPGLVELPPTPPSVQQSVLMPVLAGGLIAVLLSVALAWSLSRPIRLLRQAFGAAATGHLDMRVAPQLGRQRDEFADLARDYDRMAQQLQALLGAQRRLMHDVSHELRSPLARLQMATGLLRQSPQGLEAALARIDHEVDRLDALVDEVLTLARLESGVPLKLEGEVNVVGLLASVAEDARFEARAQGSDLSLSAEPASLVLRVHGELLLRAFENVIRNAVKYSAPGTAVDVRATLQPTTHTWQVCISDRGPGLPADALRRAFDPFVRLGDEARVPGFGLGLAIARRAIESHGGAITGSPRDGGGLTLTLSLPLPTAAAN
jgi:two-component system, OmpR family, sensor kinase